MSHLFQVAGTSGHSHSDARSGCELEGQTPKRAVAAMLRDTQDRRLILERSMADAVHFDWLTAHLLVPPPANVDFDVRKPLDSYARLFNRVAFPVGQDDRLAHALIQLGRDTQVIPGLENGKKRSKLLCLAVHSQWMAPQFEAAFPQLNEGLGLVESLVGSDGAAFTEAQIVTFSEWKRRKNPQQIAMGNRMNRLGEKIAKVGATLEVITWDSVRFDWNPELDCNGQPIMKRFIRPCHWRLDRWSWDDGTGQHSTKKG